jgi:hypothetical protein
MYIIGCSHTGNLSRVLRTFSTSQPSIYFEACGVHIYVLFEPTRVQSGSVHNDMVAGTTLYGPFPLPFCQSYICHI